MEVVEHATALPQDSRDDPITAGILSVVQTMREATSNLGPFHLMMAQRVIERPITLILRDGAGDEMWRETSLTEVIANYLEDAEVMALVPAGEPLRSTPVAPHGTLNA